MERRARTKRWAGGDRNGWSGGAVVALLTAVGLLTGARAIAHIEAAGPASLLRPLPLPRETLGMSWSSRAVWPLEIQAAAMERLIAVVLALVASAALLATLNAAILLIESASARRAELSVRSAVGASPVELVLMLLRELRALGTLALALGLSAGALAGSIARLTWPGVTDALGWLPGADLAIALAGLGAAVALLYVRAGVRTARPERAAAVLRSGARTDADPMAIFVRKVLTAGHTSVAGALLVASLALAAATRPTHDGDGAETPVTYVMGVRARDLGAWDEALSQLARIPGVEAESLSTPGALVGLGVRDLATAECGRCSRGLMPAPLWTVVADHHAVTPEFFDLAGVELLDGQRFDARAASDEPVALVNLTFARTAFERGRPVGKSVLLGSGLGTWYRVIGVVADQDLPLLGDDGLPRSVVYLDARAHPPVVGSVVVRGSATAAAAAAGLLDARGFDVQAPRTAEAHRAEATATLRWTGRLSILIALLALATAAHGVYLSALQTTRRRRRDLAVRRALGAGSRGILAFVLGERLRVIGWGLFGFAFFGTLAIGVLRNAAGLPVPGPGRYLAIGAAVSLIGLAASGRAAREAIAVEPAALLD